MESVSYCDLVWNTNINREKVLEFDKAITGKYITIDHADILWNYNKLRGTEKENYYVSTNDGTGYSKLLFEDGYYTFKEIAKKLKERDITLTYDKNSLKSKVETKLPLKLCNLGKLLGFNDETSIPANSSKVSENMVNINDGLQTVTVMCDKVNSSKNFFNGVRTQVLWTFSVPSEKKLKGGVSEFKDIDVTKPIDGINIDRLTFRCSEEIGWITLRFRVHN